MRRRGLGGRGFRTTPADDTVATVKDLRTCGLRYARQAHRNRGPAANSDTCMRLGTAKYLYLLCDDDRVLPEGIAAALEALEADAGVAAGGHQERDPVADRGALKTSPIAERKLRFERESAAKFSRPWRCCVLVMRREVFQKRCTVSTTPTRSGSGGWCRRYSRRGRSEIVPECLYKHAHHRAAYGVRADRKPVSSITTCAPIMKYFLYDAGIRESVRGRANRRRVHGQGNTGLLARFRES